MSPPSARPPIMVMLLDRTTWAIFTLPGLRRVVVMNVMDGLQHAASNGSNPEKTIETLHRKEFRQWAIAAFRYDVKGVAIFESVKNVSNVRMTKKY